MNNAAFSPAPTADVSIEMLREVFGTAINHIVGGNTTAAQSDAANMLGTAFGYFNGGVLFFGAIILTWVTVFGLTNTANDGEVMGKKWSTFYTPLRTFTASAFLIPSTSGYSMVQLAILLIVTWSVGFASGMWGKVVDYAVNTQAISQAILSIQEDPNFDQMAYNALRMQVCAYAVSQGVNQTMGAGSTSFQPYYLNDTSQSIGAKNPNSSLWLNPYQSTTYTTTVMMKDPNWAGSEDICGKLVLTNTYVRPDTNSGTMQDIAASVRNAVNTVRFQYAVGLLSPNSDIGAMARQIIQVAESDGQTISAKSINDRVVAIRSQMMTDLTQQVRAQVTNDNAIIVSKFKERGWVMAGSLHRELAQIKDAIRSATSAKSQFVPGTSSVNHLIASGAVSSAIQTVMQRYDGLVATIIQKSNPNSYVVSTTGQPTLPSLQTSFTADDFADGGNSIKSKISGYFNRLSDSLLQGMIFYLAEDGSDPVMQVKNVGDWMATFGETVLVTKGAVVAPLAGLLEGAKVASNQSVLGTNVSSVLAIGPAAIQFALSTVQELWNVAQPGVMTLLYGGYFLGMWIPMVPFYVFGLGVIGWLVQVVEALAAGSLWMVMHLTPERDDSFIGSQQQGYLLLMSLFARPPLMVLGVVASMAILTPAIRFINAGFITSFRIIQADSVTGFLSVAGYMLIYGVIVAGVFMLVFSLPQTLPDRILRWIGAGIADLGEQDTMGRIESSASGQAKGAAIAGAAGLARRDQARKPRNAQRENSTVPEPDGARPEGHTK